MSFWSNLKRWIEAEPQSAMDPNYTPPSTSLRVEMKQGAFIPHQWSPKSVVLPPRVDILQVKLDLVGFELVLLLKEVAGSAKDGREWTIRVPFGALQRGREAFYGR